MPQSRTKLPEQYIYGELRGVVREGDHSQHISEVIEIWKGRYKDEVVALRVFKLSNQDPDTPALKSVGTLGDPPGLFIIVLMSDTAAFLGSGNDGMVQARQCFPFLWGIDGRHRLLPCISLV